MADGSVVRAGDVKAHSEDQQWDPQEISSVKGVPWAPASTVVCRKHVPKIDESGVAALDPAEPAPDSFREEFEYDRHVHKFGGAEGCRTCQSLRHGTGVVVVRHSQTGRA